MQSAKGGGGIPRTDEAGEAFSPDSRHTAFALYWALMRIFASASRRCWIGFACALLLCSQCAGAQKLLSYETRKNPLPLRVAPPPFLLHEFKRRTS